MRNHLSFVAWALLASAAFGQQMSVADVLKSGAYPTKISVQDLPANYNAVKITITAGSDYSATYLPMFFIGQIQGPNRGDMYAAVTNSWTAGESLTLEGGAKFLVTYKLSVDFVSASQSIASNQGNRPPLPTDLVLELVRMDTIAVLSPNPMFTKDRLVATILGNETQAVSASKKTATLSNIKQVALGTMIYMSDYDDEIPYVQNTATLVEITMPYMKNREVWKSLNPKGGRLLFNTALSGVNAASIENPNEMPMFYEEFFWPDGSRAVAYADGHAKFVNQAEWATIAKQLAKRFKRTGKPLPVQGTIIK
jgi:hypothetical protein